MLRTFIYDTHTLDSTYSGSYTQGRLVAVQNASFTPNGYVPGIGGNGNSVPSPVQFTEMYAYTQAGLTSGKRLQVQEKFDYYVNNVHEQSTQTMNLDGAYTFDNEGKMTSVNYPTTKYYNQGQWNTTTGPTYTYSFDAMSRPTGLTDQNNTTDVSNVSYNAANQLLGITYFGKNESRTYNTLNQMTNVTIGSTMNITYTFPTANNNNGKISSSTDAISGETVTYQYDSLNRLLSASSNKGWTETYGFDGFGNLLSKTPTGGAPTLSQAVNAATNRIVGQNYDANGNQTSSSTGTLTYDAENRVLTAASNGIQYAYDSRNKRIWSATMSGANMTQVLTYFGVDGQKLGTYTVSLGPGPAPQLGATVGTLPIYFGGKRVGTTYNGVTSPFTQDRLGSNGSYYPYGETRGTPPGDDVGFATYTGDSATGLYYADQRYYASNWGRFMSPDPYAASGGPSDPGSWNRYVYTRGDPLNRFDQGGTCDQSGDSDTSVTVCGGDTTDLEYVVDASVFDILFGGQAQAGTHHIVGRADAQRQQKQREALLQKMQERLNAVKDAIKKAVGADPKDVFTASELDCISAIETGETWNPDAQRGSGDSARYGLFQFNQKSWDYSGTSIAWDNGQSAEDPYTAASVAIALLYRDLGYSGVGNPTSTAIQNAIDKFGQNDGKYGAAVMDCAKNMDAGNFDGAMSAVMTYQKWKANH